MLTTHDNNRENLKRDIAKFLAGGGKIKHVDHTANKSYKEPVKKTRAQQIRAVKQRTFKSQTEDE